MTLFIQGKVAITGKPGVKLETPDGTVLKNKVSFPRMHTFVDLSRICSLSK
jgi:hypothetical protein